MGKEKGKLNSSNLLSSCRNIADLGYMSTVEKKKRRKIRWWIRDYESNIWRESWAESIYELSDPCRIFNLPLTDADFYLVLELEMALGVYS